MFLNLVLQRSFLAQILYKRFICSVAFLYINVGGKIRFRADGNLLKLKSKVIEEMVSGRLVADDCVLIARGHQSNK